MENNEIKLCRTTLKSAKCSVDLGDGSERGLYVSQDYILQRLGRPHRAINIMYCYYPFDKEWPARISTVVKPDGTGNAWMYPYDDYEPFVGEKPYEQMRDIRRHGQEPILTLTCDPVVTDEQIAAIGETLRPYGQMMLRLNHEATGGWFSFNKRCTYQQVADFYVRFCKVMKRTAPNVKMLLCIGGVEKEDGVEMEREQEFAQTVREADLWSIDQYTALNWGWPAEVAEKDNFNHKALPVSRIFDMAKRSYERFTYLNGGVGKPMQIAEFNDDGDVLRPKAQAKRVRDFYDLIERDGEGWFTGLTMYQFRDDGRLGLEVTDPNNASVGVEQPLFSVYREIIHRPYFCPTLTEEGEAVLPFEMRWGSSEDAEGIAMEIPFEQDPVFAEAVFEGELAQANLMMEIRGRWFFKAPGVTRIDLLPAFWENPLEGAETVALRMFAPPADGLNHDDGHADWQINHRTVLTALPALRIRYEGCLPMC